MKLENHVDAQVMEAGKTHTVKADAGMAELVTDENCCSRFIHRLNSFKHPNVLKA